MFTQSPQTQLGAKPTIFSKPYFNVTTFAPSSAVFKGQCLLTIPQGHQHTVAILSGTLLSCRHIAVNAAAPELTEKLQK